MHIEGVVTVPVTPSNQASVCCQAITTTVLYSTVRSTRTPYSTGVYCVLVYYYCRVYFIDTEVLNYSTCTVHTGIQYSTGHTAQYSTHQSIDCTVPYCTCSV